MSGDEEAPVGFEVHTAETGEEALERMAEWVPDILLLDLKLPGISGLDVLRQVNAARAADAHGDDHRLRDARDRHRRRPSRAPTTSCRSRSPPTNCASPSASVVKHLLVQRQVWRPA